MEKVRLTLDELNVQSFATTQQQVARRGTVRAHDAPTDEFECPTQNAAYNTCWGTCADSCQCSDSCDCDTANCSVELDCWYTDWGPCTMGGTGWNPSDC